MATNNLDDLKQELYLSASLDTPSSIEGINLSSSFSEISLDDLASCSGTAGTAGTFGTFGGCFGTFGSVGSYGCS